MHSKNRITDPLFSLLGILLLSTCLLSGLQAQQPLLSPQAFHGYELGTRYTVTGNHFDYYKHLAENSPHVDHVEYGRSIQNRPLVSLFISSEENLRNKEVIRRRNARYTQVTERLSTEQLAEFVEDTPAILWIFIVDTDEEAGVEVLSEIAYELATKDDPLTRKIRDNLIVIFSPLTNPDSHARYVTWHQLYDVHGAANDPQAVENTPHWGMNTDGNAHGIDVNRDFGFFVTPEMSALGKAITEWRPHLILDVHSGPTTHFVPPYGPPYHDLWPEKAYQWWVDFAEETGRRFAERGWSLFSRSNFDGLANVGFGLSWGMLSTSVSTYLFETYGGRPGRTTSFIRTDGTLATMRMAMDRHALGAWTLMELAVDKREELLHDCYEMVVEGVEAASAGELQQVIIPAEGPSVDPTKVNRLVNRLMLQGIEVRQATDELNVVAKPLMNLHEPVDTIFAEGTFVIDFQQPQARLARALLDPTIDERNPQVWAPSWRKMPFYDVTWNILPYIFGVEAYGTATRADLPTTTRTLPAAVETDVRKAYAYAIPNGREANLKLITQLLQDGFKIRAFKNWFEYGGKRYPKGTFAILSLRNPESLHQRLNELNAYLHADIIPIDNPFTEKGVTFGDDQSLAPIPKPAVAIVADQPVPQDHVFGGIRTVLEDDFQFIFSPVMLSTINGGDLSNYTTVVLPHAGMDIRGGPGFNAGYNGKLQTDNLRTFVQNGGTLVAMHGACEIIAKDEVLGRGIDFKGWAEYTNGVILRAAFTEKENPGYLVDWRPGLTEVGKHLLASGYGDTTFAAPAAFPVLLEKSGDNVEVVAHYSADSSKLLLDGYMLPEDSPKLTGAPFMLVATVGKGKVVYFAADITFRGYWYGLNTMFLNSLLLGAVR